MDFFRTSELSISTMGTKAQELSYVEECLGSYKKADRPLIVMTSMGPTETCAKSLKTMFERKGIEVVTFHSNGAGGKAMEKMIREENVAAVVDLSLHELMDRYFGGAFDPGPDRCAAAIENRIPLVLIPGNIDFLAAGPMEKAKAKFGNRKYHKHNAHTTYVGATLAEIGYVARLLAGRCNRGSGPIAVLVPEKGFSDFSKAGGPLENLDAPPVFADAFFSALKRKRPVHFGMMTYHINDDMFIKAVFETIERISLRFGYLRKDFEFPLWAFGPAQVQSMHA
jgi:uncharacterized protein (UPF0261 family)